MSKKRTPQPLFFDNETRQYLVSTSECMRTVGGAPINTKLSHRGVQAVRNIESSSLLLVPIRDFFRFAPESQFLVSRISKIQ